MPSYLTRSIVFIIPVIGCRILDSSSFVESYINDTFKLASLEAFYTWKVKSGNFGHQVNYSDIHLQTVEIQKKKKNFIKLVIRLCQ